MIIEYTFELFKRLKNIAYDVVDFLNSDILGEPLIYWLLGAGLLAYLSWRIIQAVTPL